MDGHALDARPLREVSSSRGPGGSVVATVVDESPDCEDTSATGWCEDRGPSRDRGLLLSGISLGG